MLISERLKKLQKNAHTKSYKETNLMNIGKSEKSTFFHHIFVNNFLCMIFLQLFQQLLNQHKNLRFLIYSLIYFAKKIFWWSF